MEAGSVIEALGRLRNSDLEAGIDLDETGLGRRIQYERKSSKTEIIGRLSREH
jgi:hypothetical protein